MQPNQQENLLTKKYCCLYHFAQGKKQKASSPCNNHVPLGIINPLPSSVPRSPLPSPTDLKIKSRSHQINFHTHDINQIQNKKSLPKRLAYPRIYVEQITKKHRKESSNPIATYEAFLKKKEFQQIFCMFKRIAKLTLVKSQAELYKTVVKFSSQNRIKPSQLGSQTSAQLYFTQKQFINFLIHLGFQDKEAQQFWNIAYNQARFMKNEQNNLKTKSQVISMKAFIYNFKKFYLDELETYKNCLSEAALRQRMIDLRLFLQPWFTHNIIFKENHQIWKERQLQLCTELKRYNEERLYVKLISQIELRNKIWLFMRTLAKIIFQVTDQKNVGLQVFNDRATSLITKQTNNLQSFADFMNEFQNHLLSNGKSKEDPFKITDLLQFAKVKFPTKLQNIMCYLRGIFKYLYFFNKNPLLVLNHSTLNLDCSGIAEITYNDLLQFVGYKANETNHLIQMIDSICQEVNQTVDARPELTGHKNFLNECNYLAESFLKMIKRCDFSVFYRLHLCRQIYFDGNRDDLQRLKYILEDPSFENQQIKESFWKKMFSFIEEQPLTSKINETDRDQVFDKNYKAAVGAYEQLRKKLQGKLPSKMNVKQDENETNFKRKSQEANQKAIISKNKTKTNQSNNENAEISFQPTKAQHTCFNSAYCPLCDDICSTEMTASLNKIDEMSSYLMDLLNGV